MNNQTYCHDNVNSDILNNGCQKWTEIRNNANDSAIVWSHQPNDHKCQYSENKDNNPDSRNEQYQELGAGSYGCVTSRGDYLVDKREIQVDTKGRGDNCPNTEYMITHEAFVGMCLNIAMFTSPTKCHNFLWTYGLLKGKAGVFDLFLERCLKGVTLKDWISNQTDRTQLKPLDGIIRQIYFALAMAHERCGFIHNDLHLSNIMIVDNGETGAKTTVYHFGGEEHTVTSRYDVFIIDYGLATCMLPRRATRNSLCCCTATDASIRFINQRTSLDVRNNTCVITDYYCVAAKLLHATCGSSQGETVATFVKTLVDVNSISYGIDGKNIELEHSAIYFKSDGCKLSGDASITLKADGKAVVWEYFFNLAVKSEHGRYSYDYVRAMKQACDTLST
jgi:hypothetical protein